MEQATGKREVNAICYYVGGALPAAALALLAQKVDHRFFTVTFFTTQADFTYASDLKVFLDEEQTSTLERAMGGGKGLSRKHQDGDCLQHTEV